MTISEITAFLESAFDVLNEKYFESALPKCAITIQLSPKAYGHFTTKEVWQGGEEAARHEINLGAENLNRPLVNTLATLVHEMVHFFCHINGIKDTSRSGVYHNKRFKEEAERRGLIIEYDKKIGWSKTTPSPTFAQYVKKQWQGTAIESFRIGDFGADGRTAKKSSTRKYICPICAQSVRATKEVLLLCGVCSVDGAQILMVNDDVL